MKVCENVLDCVSKLKRETSKDKTPKSKKRKNKHSKAKALATSMLSQSPCKDSSLQEKCISFLDSRSKPKCEEHGKTYVLDNSISRKEVACVHIDSGVVDSIEVSKCDYGFFIRPSDKNVADGIAIFVELKGSNTKHALEQLTSTLQLSPFQKIKEQYSSVYGRVICTNSTPKIQSTEQFLDALEQFLVLGGNVKIRPPYYEELFSDLNNLEK